MYARPTPVRKYEEGPLGGPSWWLAIPNFYGVMSAGSVTMPL